MSNRNNLKSQIISKAQELVKVAPNHRYKNILTQNGIRNLYTQPGFQNQNALQKLLQKVSVEMSAAQANINRNKSAQPNTRRNQRIENLKARVAARRDPIQGYIANANAREHNIRTLVHAGHKRRDLLLRNKRDLANMAKIQQQIETLHNFHPLKHMNVSLMTSENIQQAQNLLNELGQVDEQTFYPKVGNRFRRRKNDQIVRINGISNVPFGASSTRAYTLVYNNGKPAGQVIERLLARDYTRKSPKPPRTA